MRKFMMVAGVALAAALSGAAATDNTQPSYATVFDATWNTVNDNFYDPNFHGVDWKAVGDRTRAKLPGMTNDKQFEALVTAMLHEIGTSHIYIRPPSASKASGAGIGVHLREIDGQNVIADIAPLSDAHAQGLHAGDKLVSSRDALTGPLGERVTATFEDCTGHAHSVTLRHVGGFWPPPHPAFEWSMTKLGPHRNIGYIRIDRFDDGAAELADRAMAELKDTDALIIDVRANSGGNLSALRLASYFMGAAQPAAALFARPYLQALGHGVTAADVTGAARVNGAYTDESIFAAVSAHRGAATFWSDDVGDRRYGKPVVVLIGGDTGSAAEGFAWAMRKAPMAKFVGRRTAGALLSAADFDLPGGWKLTVPVQGVWGANGTDYRDKAVDPDYAVRWSRADMCAGRDPDIAKALSLLE
ncbi:MAG TPA: S41 family peptidase [Rhizomicrobium sp.]